MVTDSSYYYSRVISGLGAFGVVLQNYPAIDIALKGLLANGFSISKLSQAMVQVSSLSSCGMVNFWMNVELLDGFFKRLNSTNEYQYKSLTTWQQMQYFGGILIFVITGILYGLMAFTFAMEGPLATLSIAAGVFVAGIMTIQEVETWLSSYDNPNDTIEEPLTNTQQFGKFVGHLIALGNVVALSLLFSLSLAEGLRILNVAALPALIIGLSVSFTFGAFTEYYFYNFYLANFCKNFDEKLTSMAQCPNAAIGMACVTTNALVNAALTYAGFDLLQGILIAASITLPPASAITMLAITTAFFAGSASLILGMDFWIRQNNAKIVDDKVVSSGDLGLFGDRKEAANDEVLDTKSLDMK